MLLMIGETKCTFNIKNEEIKIVPCYKCLGILFDQHNAYVIQLQDRYPQSCLKCKYEDIVLFAIIHLQNYLQHQLCYFRLCFSHRGY